MSVALGSTADREAGQIVVAPHSFVPTAIARRTLSSPSRLSTVDCPSAGSGTGQGPDIIEVLPLFFLGAMAERQMGADARPGRERCEPQGKE